ncbi:MAG: glycosyltransferase family 2 protein [Deltaproteobacteria bacterium]|nr:glycosyltransferase family 2 protein [Deltaproteobacteria bacterium]
MSVAKMTEPEGALQRIPEDRYRIDPMPGAPRPATLSCGISVIIPVKDGGETFAELLGKIRSQKKVGEIEIIVLDSESTDGSVAIAESFGCRVVGIPRKEFNHGATRDLGARQARGEYLVFTVQDAMPVGNYWLYGMVSPFFPVPDLGAVSSMQFVRPEADLFSLWTNHETNAMIGIEGDAVYGLSPSFDFSNWERLDAPLKRRLSFVDNVSSCIPKSVYRDVPFRPLINAEDVDLGIRMLEKGKRLAFLTSSGVYHWHDRGPDYVLKRHYIGTKANVHVLKNPLPRFFEMRDIGWRAFVANVADLLDLAALAVPEPGAVDPNPMNATMAFLSSFRRHFKATPAEVSAALEKVGGSCEDRLEAVCPGLFGEADLLSGERHRFRKNFLVPLFMKDVGKFTGFLAGRQLSCKGREKEFPDCIRKILASAVGEAAGAFYLESETRGRLTGELERMDQLLAKGVCHF